MAQPKKFSIGIDLGTSNSVLAFAPLAGADLSEVLAVPQWDTPSTVIDHPTVPSFLYRPEEAVAAQIRERVPGSSEWLVGRLAQRKASETPGRVVQSAKSWLCHHAADRLAQFLPWGSDELAQQEKISPVAASALILGYLRAAWDLRFAAQGCAFDDQDVTITVPASFDAAAQRLTLAAAQEAGFPDHVRLIEEPQAAFTCWLEQNQVGTENPWSALPPSPTRAQHVLVIDIGGGTSDFSLFELNRNDDGGEPAISRVAVSDHILLGGDNIDLAIAHLCERRLATGSGGLAGGQWDHLVAACRSLKEKVLGSDGAPDETFTVSLPGRGSSLLAGAQSAQVTRAELEGLVLDGFFPACKLTDRPRRALGAIKEFGLPYAFDGAITRHLAAFLNERPPVDAVLFNGGSLRPARLRAKLREQIRAWQGHLPHVLENVQFDYAVALGAARFGRQLRHGRERIEAGAARAVFLEAQAKGTDGGLQSPRRSFVCILPHGAAPNQSYEVADLGLKLRVNRLVRFQVYTSTRHESAKAGDMIAELTEVFHALPPLETIATVPPSAGGESAPTIPVAIDAEVNELGLLQVWCRSLDPGLQQTWPLEFNLRPHEGDAAAPAPQPASSPAEPGVAPEVLAAARQRIVTAFTQPLGKREKMTAQRLLLSLEQTLARPKGEWDGILLRDLWSSLEANETKRDRSADHEEAWLVLAGFLLRPGFGVPMDDLRIDALWHILSGGLRFPGKRSKPQEYILWRRVAGGLSRERQEALLAAEKDRLYAQKNVAPELIRMAGSFERLDHAVKAELIERFIDTTVQLASQQKHSAPYLAALGLLLNRTPFYTGPESVPPPALVEKAYDAFRRFDWTHPEFAEVQVLFLRAARAVDDRSLDLPRSLREKIASKLEKAGVASAKTNRLRHAVPVERAERLSLYGEALPPGLILS
ncbi:MAG: Hsp70 family protein [Xanthobacteraceae bacterium]